MFSAAHIFGLVYEKAMELFDFRRLPENSLFDVELPRQPSWIPGYGQHRSTPDIEGAHATG